MFIQYNCWDIRLLLGHIESRDLNLRVMNAGPSPIPVLPNAGIFTIFGNVQALQVFRNFLIKRGFLDR